MSEQELYEVARRRIDSRNRRWTLWAVDLGGLILTLSALVIIGGTRFAMLGAAIFLAWGGVFTFHTILLAMANSRAKDIEKEVARLRDSVYEKPKRLEIADDGELVDVTDEQSDDIEYLRPDIQRGR